MSFDLKKTTNPKWTIRLADTKSFNDLVEITDAHNKQLELYLNKSGSFTFDINLESPNAPLFKPVETCIKAYRNDVMVWSGIVWGISDSAPDNKTQINCVGWFEYLNHRMIYEELQYTDVDAGQIAFDLLDKSYLWKKTKTFQADFTDSTIVSYPGSSTISNKINNGDSFEFSVTGSPPPNVFTDATIRLNSGLSRGKKYLLSVTVTNDTGLSDTSSLYGFNFSVKDPVFAPARFILTSSNDEVTRSTSTEPLSLEYLVVLDISAFDAAMIQAFGQPVDLNSPIYISFSHSIVKPYYSYMEYTYNIKVEEFEKVYDIPVIAGSSEASQLRTRSYPKFSNVGQELISLSEIESGYDMDIDNENRFLNIYKRIGQDMDITFDYNFGANNVKQVSIQYDPSRMTNKFTALGQSVSFTTDDTDKQEQYGIFAETGSASSTNESAILGAYANAEIAIRNNPIITYDFQPLPTGADNTPAPFEDYNIGDSVYLSAKKGRIEIDHQKVRIFGMTINIDDNGLETVSAIKTQAT